MPQAMPGEGADDAVGGEPSDELTADPSPQQQRESEPVVPDMSGETAPVATAEPAVPHEPATNPSSTERDLSSAARALAALVITERPRTISESDQDAQHEPAINPDADQPEPSTHPTIGGTPAARVALVTGAGRGIGRAIALGLARAGLSVALLGRSPGALEDVAALVAAHGVGASWAGADVRDYEQVHNAVARLEAALGDIDLLVNNAGVIEPVEVPVWDAGPETWWHVVETDLRGPFHCVRAAVPGMVERGAGRVINLNSSAGAADRDVYSAYSAAKAGLFRITGSLHLAGFDRGIRAFELSPGVVRTEMTTAMAMHSDRREWTPVEAVVDLVIAIAQGRLDAWSGRFLRAGTDTADALDAAEFTAGEGGLSPDARRLGILPYGPADPLD
jgi:3-oxoacyl-[acyl-carrier protein] reductase